MLTFLYLWILVALRSHSDELVGILLPLVAYQWEIGGLFFLFILAFVLVNRRWKVLVGCTMSLSILLIVSFLVYPGWGLPYLRGSFRLVSRRKPDIRSYADNPFP